MRRALIAAVAGLIAAGLAILRPSPATAQPGSAVVLRLASQSPWNSPRQPLEISFTATNNSTAPMTGLSVQLSLYTRPSGRSVYELSLHAQATGILLSWPFAQEGTLEPGQTRTFTIRQPLTQMPTDQSGLYPATVELRSQDVSLGIIRTPVIFLVERPKVPLNLAWTWSLAEPVQYAPDGTFLPGPIEEDVSPGGRLSEIVQALQLVGDSPADVVISPVLLVELQRLAAGYRVIDASGVTRSVPKGSGGAAAAAALLQDLRKLASRHVEVVGLPFGDPSIPSLLRAGLGGDLPALVQRGDEELRRVLDVVPSSTVSRPPFSQLDAASLTRMASTGTRTVLVDPGFVPAPAGTYSPPSTIRLTAGHRAVNAVLPDSGVATILATYQADPVLAAHAVLGELASTWLEFPGTPGRGLAMLFPEQGAYGPRFLQTFATLVQASRWLRPVTASRLLALVPPTARQPVPDRFPQPGIAPGYVARLMQARAALQNFQGAVERAGHVVTTMHEDLLLADSATFIADPALGIRFMDAVLRRVQDTYRSVAITSTVVTLASQRGFIPVTLSNKSGLQIRVVLRLVADRRLQFVNGNSMPVLLDRSTHTFTFRVRAQTTGRFPIDVEVQTPGSGSFPDTIARAEMIVRSTAYNRVALFLTIGAAVFFLGWWGRRFLPRRTR